MPNAFRDRKLESKYTSLGCVAHVMANSPRYRSNTAWLLAHWIQPAIALNQIEIVFFDNLPVGYLTWAYLSSETARRLVQQPTILHASEWNEGELPWIIDVCGMRSDMLRSVRRFIDSRFVEVGQVYWARGGADGRKRIYRYDIAREFLDRVHPDALPAAVDA